MVSDDSTSRVIVVMPLGIFSKISICAKDESDSPLSLDAVIGNILKLLAGDETVLAGGDAASKVSTRMGRKECRTNLILDLGLEVVDLAFENSMGGRSPGACSNRNSRLNEVFAA